MTKGKPHRTETGLKDALGPRNERTLRGGLSNRGRWHRFCGHLDRQPQALLFIRLRESNDNGPLRRTKKQNLVSQRPRKHLCGRIPAVVAVILTGRYPRNRFDGFVTDGVGPIPLLNFQRGGSALHSHGRSPADKTNSDPQQNERPLPRPEKHLPRRAGAEYRSKESPSEVMTHQEEKGDPGQGHNVQRFPLQVIVCPRPKGTPHQGVTRIEDLWCPKGARHGNRFSF